VPLRRVRDHHGVWPLGRRQRPHGSLFSVLTMFWVWPCAPLSNEVRT
jgi:hypothetical protein